MRQDPNNSKNITLTEALKAGTIDPSTFDHWSEQFMLLNYGLVSADHCAVLVFEDDLDDFIPSC